MTQRILKNIAIGSTSATGATTLLHELEKHLSKEGFTCISTGQLMRAKAAYSDDAHNPLAQNLSHQTHQEMDDHVRAILASGKPYVIEGWLAGFVAKDIPHTLKVLVTLSDPIIKAERFAKREAVSLDEATSYINDRDSKNALYWQHMYDTDAFWDPNLYDIVIDTAHTTPAQEAQRVLDVFHKGVL